MQHDTAVAYPRRPLLVSLLAFLLALQGILAILAGVFAMLNLASVVDVLSIQGHVITRPVIDIIGYVLGGMSLALGVVIVALALGLWRLRRWAFWTAVILLLINLGIQAALFIRSHTQNPIEIASLVVSGLLLLYFLLIPGVRKAFLRRPHTTPATSRRR